MKKKGLIISTVVMVVVLIASLTTATYAWFTASSKTEIKGFDVSVISNNAVNIGVKETYTHDTSENGVSPDAFFTNTAKYVQGASLGIVGGGTWTGDTPGLSATLDPSVNWGAQSAAIGSTAEPVADGATATKLDTSKVTTWNGANTVVKGNKDGTQVAVTKAQPNNSGTDGSGNGDYVHFILGVSPTKDLGTNNFVIVVEPSTTGSSLGVLASIHVAYRITNYKHTSTGGWKDVDVYGTANNGNTWKTSVKPNTDTTNGGELVTGALLTAYQSTYGKNVNVPTGSIAYQISGLDLNKDEITQLEVVIYMAGADDDCNDQGKTAAGSIKMFFNTQEKSSALTKAEYTVHETNGTTVDLAGYVTGATVEYSTDGTTWKSAGAVTNNQVKIADLTAVPKLYIRQTEKDKAPSNQFEATPKQ